MRAVLKRILEAERIKPKVWTSEDDKEYRRAYMRAYYQRPDVKERRRAYYQSHKESSP